jgi:hypothetical protein
MRALLGDSQNLTITGIIESLPICELPKVQKIRKQTMNSLESLKHTKWECKYHTHPLKVVMKDKVQEYADKFANLKIKPAS